VQQPFCNLYRATQVYLKEVCINYRISLVSGCLFGSISLRERLAAASQSF
jgi:hypothetical protein